MADPGRAPETPQERAARWEPVLADPRDAPLLRTLVLAAAPDDADDTARLLNVVSGLADWARETGLPIDETTLTDPLVARRYAAVAMPGLSPSWRLQVVNRLDRLAETAGRSTAGLARPPAGRRTGAPYTAREIDALLRWADGQPSTSRRHAQLTVLAGGLGAGLGNADLRTVRGTDIRRLADGTVVATVPAGPAPREIPVLHRYEELLASLAETAGPAWLLAPHRTPGGRNTVAWPIKHTRRPPTVPALAPERCRATWIAAHLAAGTRLDALLPAAGVDAAGVVLRLAGLLRPEPPAEAAHALRTAHHPLGPVTAPPTPPGPPAAPPSVLQPAAVDALARWKPRTGPPARTAAAREIAAAADAGTPQNVLYAATAAADLLAWAERHGRPSATAADAVDPAVVDAWDAADDGAARWTPATRRPRLRWIRNASRALHHEGGLPPPALLAVPYSRDDVAAVRAHARTADARQRNAAVVVLALTAGAGLTAADVLLTTGRHVRQDPLTGAVLVRAGTGPRAREIPCMAEHENDLLAAARRAGPRWIVDPDQPRPTHDRRRLAVGTQPPGVPRLNPRRGRATWIRAQLASGTRLDTLLAAAGLTGPSNLDQWTPYLPPLTDTQKHALLRNA